MREKLRQLKVKKKLERSFTLILIAFIGAAIMSLGGIAMISANIKQFYNESYTNMKLQLEIRKDIQLAGKHVLWAITADGQEQVDLINQAVTYTQRVEENVQLLSENFSDKELTAELQTALRNLQSERRNLTGFLTVGNSEKAFFFFNGSYNDATQAIQDVLIRVGDTADAQADTAYGRVNLLVVFINIVMVVVTAVCVFLCIKLAGALTSLILEPIKELQKATQKLKAGELDINIDYNTQDELGELAADFQETCVQIRLVIDDMGYLLSRLADGNFNIDSQSEESYVGDFTLLLQNIRRMNSELNSTLAQINEASAQVMTGSGQLASSAQSLAEGATEQAGAVEELMATIADVTGISEDAAENASFAASSAKASAEDAARSREEMNALTGAMARINATSKEIENIIAAIEDIASQTNLLSLNASIEAARAGEAGRGFAVVADQIGKLAADSAQSAVTTRELISKSLIEIESGNQIVDHAMEAIASVLESMENFSTMAAGAAESSKTQAAMMKQIEQGVEQISTVVESNSAAAQETSAISEELSAQAQTLEQMVAAFELRK